LLDFGRTRTVDRVAVSFTVDATHALPAAIEVAVWNGRRYTPVTGARTAWADASDEPTVIAFDAVRGSRIRLTLTSGRPGRPEGAVRISKLEV
jgi:beta-galactosidase